MGRREIFTGFWLGGPKKRDHWKDLGVGGMITLRWTLGRQGSMGRTKFGWAQERVRWWAFVNMVMNLSRLYFDKVSNNQRFEDILLHGVSE
jgi:hypothetical protein